MRIVQLAGQPLSKRLRSRFEFTVDDETDSYDVSVGEEFYIAKTGKRPNEKIRLIVKFKNKYLAFNITQEELYEVGSLSTVIQDYHKYEDKTMNHAGGRSKNYRHRSLSKDNKMLKKKVKLTSESNSKMNLRTNGVVKRLLQSEGIDSVELELILIHFSENLEDFLDILDDRHEEGKITDSEQRQAEQISDKLYTDLEKVLKTLNRYNRLVSKNRDLVINS